MKKNIKVNNYSKNIEEIVKDLSNKKTIYKQIPNLLTISRGITPLFTIPLTISGNVIPATIIAGSTAVTDLFDGKIARKYNLVNEFGAYLDAVCDKLYAGGLLFPLAFKDKKYAFIISFEAMISLINTLSKLNNLKPSSSLIGKIKSTSLFITLITSYLTLIKSNNLKNKYLDLLITSTITLQILSFIDYYLKYKTKKKLLIKH